jgi:hypothetical protein
LQKASPIVQLNKKAELHLQLTRSMGFLLAFRRVLVSFPPRPSRVHRCPEPVLDHHAE